MKKTFYYFEYTQIFSLNILLTEGTAAVASKLLAAAALDRCAAKSNALRDSLATIMADFSDLCCNFPPK